MSERKKDNLFKVDYEFLELIELWNSDMSGSHENIDGEVEHEWQMRRTNTVEDLIYSLYEWIDKPVPDSQTDFRNFLTQSVLPWYVTRVSISTGIPEDELL